TPRRFQGGRRRGCRTSANSPGLGTELATVLCFTPHRGKRSGRCERITSVLARSHRWTNCVRHRPVIHPTPVADRTLRYSLATSATSHPPSSPNRGGRRFKSRNNLPGARHEPPGSPLPLDSSLLLRVWPRLPLHMRNPRRFFQPTANLATHPAPPGPLRP